MLYSTFFKRNGDYIMDTTLSIVRFMVSETTHAIDATVELNPNLETLPVFDNNDLHLGELRNFGLDARTFEESQKQIVVCHATLVFNQNFKVDLTKPLGIKFITPNATRLVYTNMVLAENPHLVVTQ